MWSERRRTMAGRGALCWMRLLLVVGVMCARTWASVPLVRLRQDAAPTKESVGPLMETVSDDILPLNRWRRVHAVLNEETKIEIEEHLVGMGVPYCKVERPETCCSRASAFVEEVLLSPSARSAMRARRNASSTARKESGDQARHHGHRNKHHHRGRHHHRHDHDHRRQTRQIQPEIDSVGSGVPVSFRFLNAAPGKGNVSLSLQANQQGLLPGRNDLNTEGMPYGVALQSSYRLILDDHFAVQASNGEAHRSQVDQSIFRVPMLSEFFVVSDVTHDGRLQSSLAIFDLNVSYDRAWLFTYNAMLPDLRKEGVEGVDVLLFDASKYGQPVFSLHRIARNISLHLGQEANLPNGDYEVKVVLPNSVMDVNGFKNAKSLVTPIYVRVDKNIQQFNYLVVSGSVTSQTYKPTITSVPDITIGDPPFPPQTPVYLLNADFRRTQVNVSFSNCISTFLLGSGEGEKGEVTVRRDDKVLLFDSESGKYQFPVRIGVPYSGAECTVITDRSNAGQLEGFFACWLDELRVLPPRQAWIFTYNALVGYTGKIETIIYRVDSDTGFYSLYSIAHDLGISQGVSASIAAGRYMLKVVPSGTVQNSADFMNATSLIEPTIIDLKPRTYYYAAVQRNYSAPDGGSFLAVPSLLPSPSPGSGGIAQTAVPSSASRPGTPVVWLLVTVASLLVLLTAR